MFAFLKRTVVVLLGLLLIVVFIWYAGPYFAFAEYHPLESSSARLIAIGIVLGVWLFARLVKRLRRFRASDRLLAAVVAQPQPEPARTPAEVVKLRERFEEAVAALKHQRRSGHSLYELPWYVIIGAPGSGKTTALLNSGLQFPLEQRVGKGALRGVGGTRNCDWWFTDQAVFLDTAGRYTTQDSDATSDSLGWSEFLALLRKYRARRPLNGVIVTASAQDLLLLDAVAREAHIEAARTRLAELRRELRIQLPVYLMVTKCDLVDGFAEYFGDLTAEGRAQVWGVTFPYEQSLANDGPDLFPAEFDALVTRLNERMFDRMEDERDTRRRTKVLAFPQQLAMLREALTQWVADVFDVRDFEGQVLLRGVYFTSGTQEGTPIDRLLGSIGRTFGSSDAVTTPRGPGKAYFVQALLKHVMIGESGLAGVNRRLELRNASLLLGAYAATGLLAALAVTALSISYNRNQNFLEQIAADIAVFEQMAAVTPTSPLDQIVARLDGIRAVVASADRYRETTSPVMRWGLYEGRSIGKSALDAYLRELDSIVLPLFAAQIRTRMSEYATDPRKLFAYFKGYLMLADPRRLDKEYLKSIAEVEWKQATGTAASAGPALAQHFDALLDNSSTLRPIPVDPTLIGQTRNTIPRSLMPRIWYEDIKREAMADSAQGLRIDQVAGLEVERIFRRRSGVPLSTPMPRLYTRAAFQEIAVTGRAQLLQHLAKDAWVWGDNAAAPLKNAGALLSEVASLYETDYIRAWNGLLDDLQLVPFATIPQAKEALRILTSPTSPLRGILRVVADHTTLVDAKTSAAPSGVVGQTKKKVTDAITGVIKPMQDAVGMAPVTPGTQVTAEFQWVRQLTAGEPGKTQLDGVLQTLTEIQKEFDTLGADVAGASPLQIMASPSFRVLMQTLRQQAEALPRSLRRVVTEIADVPEEAVIAGATARIEEVYSEQVVPTCNSLIANKYPFARSNIDVQLADFAAVFGHDGLFDKFFAEYLEKQVDTTGASWQWRPGSVRPSRRLLDQFQQARRIRDLFFVPGSRTPKVEFFVAFSDLDANARRFVLQVDGQNMDDKHSKQAFSWPGPTPGHATTAFESRYYDPVRRYGGPWAWFRMVDETRVGSPDSQQRIVLNIQSQYHRVRLTVEPARATTSPVATGSWRQFSCES